MMRWLAVWLIWATPAFAEIEAEFATFVQEFGIGPASLTLMRPDGSVLVDTAVGQGADAAAPILSISKTLAGACTLHAEQMDRVALEDTVGDYLGWEGPAGEATLAQLLTHSSGYRPDRTQRDYLGRFLSQPARIEKIIERRRTSDRGNLSYFYNNENFIVLEAVLTAALGTPALDWCLRETPSLAKMESLRRAEGYDAIGLAGGLAVQTRELAAFMHALAPDDTWPTADVDDGIVYGPGVVLVKGRLVHRGGMCLITGWGHGAIAAKDSRGWSIGFTYTGCPSPKAEAALQAILDAAVARETP
ncbi:MAG: beta-lactamase family protein [Rhodobacteraceae bacterium]|nr:beta-lactamase family protein [Paracoccaceae bacterium]